MIKRVIVVTQKSYLHVADGQLVVDQDGTTVATIPCEDIGLLLLEHSATVVTHKALLSCQENDAAVILCDERHMPHSLMLPISRGHTLHSKVLKCQIEVSKPLKKRLWKKIVKAKIDAQSKTLKALNKDSAGLARLHAKVKSGDPENCEAQAAKLYWRVISEGDFSRNPAGDGINTLLNYGYAVVRAAVARAICGAGLHPAIGIHHKNQYNGYCLADDLMEPFRPWIDLDVWRSLGSAEEPSLDHDSKRQLLSILDTAVQYKDRSVPFLVALEYFAANFRDVLAGEAGDFVIPGLADAT